MSQEQLRTTTFVQRRRRRPVLHVHGAASVLALAAVTMSLVVLSPAPARAVENNLLLSIDGRHFAGRTTGPIFSGLSGYVPGTSTTAGIWVRNNSADAATLSIAAVSGPGNTDLARNLGLQVQSGSLKSADMALAAAGGCTQVMSGWSLQPGQTIHLEMVLALPLAASNETRSQNADFDVVFLLQDITPSMRALNACAGAGTTVRGLGTADRGGTGAPAAAAVMNTADAPQEVAPSREITGTTFESASAHSNVMVNNPFWAVFVALGTPALYLVSAARRHRRRRNA
ncbi:hypothetical protein IV500_02720 [Paeniglutamicibacter antarcticus]|uniref:Uncharacterized protein n=1 Tax=Arthrobacter terrae TaxID=2935737 RepID=A0A931G6I4_9MICC|nr:hypothetical protein [Arthrobacter terrae]MBG0738344.1 hypothetical protein [Arthrobacter terrae]